MFQHTYNSLPAGHLQIYLYDKSRKNDLLVINKMDLAPYVNVDLDRMDKDTKKMRGDRPYIFTNVKDGDNVDNVVAWIKENVLLEGYK